MNELTFDGFAAWVKDSVEDVGRTLDPDGDWTPVAFAVSDGVTIASLAGVPPSRYPVALLTFGQHVRPRYMAVVLSSWTSLMTPEEFEARGPDYRIGDDVEHRTEVLLVGVGDVEHEVWWKAPIVRSRAQVALGSWETFDPAGGRQLGSLRMACARQV